MICLVMSYIDRANIGNANIEVRNNPPLQYWHYIKLLVLGDE